MRITRLLAAVAAATVLAVLTGSPARAHNSLTDAFPARNATLGQAPDRVKLTFLQRVDPDALTIVVTDGAGREVPASGPVANGKVGTLTFDEPPAGGVYTVTYRVVSVDGHPVEGSYRFTVDGPSASPSVTPTTVAPSPAASSASAAPAPQAVPTSADSAGFGWSALVIGVIAGLAVALGAVLFRRRSTGSR